MSAAEKVELVPDLLPHRMPTAETQRVVYQVVVPPEVERKHLKDPKYWKHVATKLQPYTKLEVVTDDGRFYAEYLVLNAGQNWATVQELSYHELSGQDLEVEAQKMSEFFVKWFGPSVRYAVVRKADNERIKDGFQTQEAAATYLREYVKVISK